MLVVVQKLFHRYITIKHISYLLSAHCSRNKYNATIPPYVSANTFDYINKYISPGLKINITPPRYNIRGNGNIFKKLYFYVYVVQQCLLTRRLCRCGLCSRSAGELDSHLRILGFSINMFYKLKLKSFLFPLFFWIKFLFS